METGWTLETQRTRKAKANQTTDKGGNAETFEGSNLSAVRPGRRENIQL